MTEVGARKDIELQKFVKGCVFQDRLGSYGYNINDMVSSKA